MTDLSDEFFETALAGIQERLDDLITQPKSERGPPGQWSKDYSGLLKARADTLAQIEARDAKAFAKQYTRYEDMPPPTPEDEARFDAEFQKILSDLFGGDQG
jgi:hypothetical protein